MTPDQGATDLAAVSQEPPYRVGLGHDTHRLALGGPLPLGGVTIPHTRHAVGHSDADVLLHAITDALLGAVALGDIGELFPDTDAANRGRDSAELLRLAYDRVLDRGYHIANLDCIIFAERPKLATYKRQIQTRIGELLRLEPSRIGVKAKTGEKVDAVGSELAIQAQCIVMLVQS